MNTRAFITAVLIAGLAAGAAAGRAAAFVQPSTSQSGFASVEASVDAVSAGTALTGSRSRWFYLFNSETSALTNAVIHVVPPSGAPPPDLTAASIAPGDSLAGYLPTTSGVVAPEFDSARTVSPGSADHGTHTQTVTVTLTPQAFPPGYTSSYGVVRITGGSTASNGVVVSAPSGSSISGVGTGELLLDLNPLLPQTQYTVQVTFDVSNPDSAPVPYKPQVYISESFAEDLSPTVAQSSYGYSDSELGSVSWSVDQSVVWRPVIFRGTALTYSPVTVPTVAAWGNDWRRAYLELPAATDAVASDSIYSGWRTWDAVIQTSSTLVVPKPEISVDQSSLTFTPAVSFPLSSGVGADLTGQYQTFSLNALSGRAWGGSQVDDVSLSTGFDLTRTLSPATLPAGGGTQDVVVTFVPRDARYAQTSASISLWANPGQPPSNQRATIVAGSVTTSSGGQPEPAPVVSGGTSLRWSPNSLSVGRSYTLTLQIQVKGSGLAVPYKPQVAASTNSYAFKDRPVTGTTATISDDVLGGTFTFAAGTSVNWKLWLGDFVTATLAGIAAPADTDSSPPALSLPSEMTVEATSANGAAVTYTATATDTVDPSPTVDCTPASGSTFPLGFTTVHCTATDASGNSAGGSFAVRVVDRTPPVLSLPADITADAADHGSAAVTYTATATDTVDPSPSLACNHASGSTFPLGSTTVHCAATDASMNRANGSFTVTVTGGGPGGGGSAGGGSGGGGGGGLAADLTVEGGVSPQTATQGETLTWTFRVVDANLGPAVDVYLDLQLSDNLTYLASTTTRGGCTVSGQRLHCFLDWMSGDAATATITLTTTVAKAGEYAVAATVGQLIPDSKPANNSLVVKASAPPPPAPPPVPPAKPVRPVIAAAVATPARPAAGKRLIVTFAVTRSDTGKLFTKATMSCDPSLAGELITHAESFVNGKARLTLTVPKNAKGKLLKIKLTIKAGGQSATRITTLKVR